MAKYEALFDILSIVITLYIGVLRKSDRYFKRRENVCTSFYLTAIFVRQQRYQKTRHKWLLLRKVSKMLRI